MNKQEIRIWAKNKRKELNMELISSILSEKLIKTTEYKNAKNIMLFYPKLGEVNLLALLKDNDKKFYLPRICGEELKCCPYKDGDRLSESCFHTKEPICASCNKTELELVIVPALACDKQNYRLGYGGGFYDRFLKDFKGVKIVCIPSVFILEDVIHESHDVKMDRIITEL